ncbi:MAG: class I SAM-dependent methyltransferase [Rubrivivax sp.]|nr:class I SAM-dependent methyltransferase [Rubrivivax sp.]
MVLSPSTPALWQRWPLPAVAAWALAWALFTVLRGTAGPVSAALLASLLGTVLALRQGGLWRRAWVAGGFPLSLLASGAGGHLPAWAWLLPLALLLAVYPLRAWRDAPLFPTPPQALDALAAQLTLPPGARVLDAGCGLGDGLQALRSAWPAAHIEGLEWSAPLALLTRWRCPWAQVRRGDMWADGAWRGLALVYLFQRPESMARAWAKACDELPGGWLVSLEFSVPGRAPDLRAELPGGRPVLAWRIPAQPVGCHADIPGE